MEKYAYLILGLVLIWLAGVLILVRKDLVRLSIKLGVVGGVAGLLSELFYFRDYWRPPTTLGIAKISPEDFVFGFAITACSVIIYPVITRQRFGLYDGPNKIKTYLLFFTGGVLSLLTFNLGLGINSIFVSSALFLTFAVIIVYLRPDLLLPAVLSAVVLTALIVVTYMVLFNSLFPEFWDKYWLLANSKWGIMIFGNVPVTEMLWYFSWILFASVSYPFVSGKKFIKQ